MPEQQLELSTIRHHLVVLASHLPPAAMGWTTNITCRILDCSFNSFSKFLIYLYMTPLLPVILSSPLFLALASSASVQSLPEWLREGQNSRFPVNGHIARCRTWPKSECPPTHTHTTLALSFCLSPLKVSLSPQGRGIPLSQGVFK